MILQRSNTRKAPTTMMGGMMITAGATIGAGMFSLPTIASGMWFGWAMVCMALAWFCMYYVSLMVLEVNLSFPEGSSYDTMIQGTLGKHWNQINGVLLLFLLYILLYAFISGSGSIANHTMTSTLGYAPPQFATGAIIAISLSVVVSIGTRAVDRITTILFLGMLASFFAAIFDLRFAVNLKSLAITPALAGELPYFYYFFAALPFFFTAFGFYCIVPSLVKYYGKRAATIKNSMLYGSLLSFLFYLLWLVFSMGILQREQFLVVMAEGGNVGALVNAITQAFPSDGLADYLNIFAVFAITTSFLGVGISLFDFFADKYKLDRSASGRLKTASYAFLPPMLGGLFFPNGFIYAIGFAALVMAFNGLIIPALMLKKNRSQFASTDFQVWGGNGLIYFMIAMGITLAACHTLAMLNLLPVYGP